MLLDEDLLLEVHAIAHFHEFVGIAGIAILAGKFAAAVRIDRPFKGHADAGAAIQQGAYGQGEVFDVVSLAERLALGSKAGDTDQFRLGERQEGKRSHYSPFVRLL